MAREHEIRDLLILHRRAAGHPAVIAKLLAYFGSAAAALRQANPGLLARLGLADVTITALCDRTDDTSQLDADADLQWLAEPSHHLVLRGSPDYPPCLEEIHDAPPLIFCHGNPALLASVQVAMVGSRKMSATGRKVAGLLAADLCRAGVTVTSGLARGIDAAAHRGALSVGGNTIAVLGSGCDVVYPAMNKRLAADMLDHGGLLVSEFPLRTGARNFHFPQRNRIVTGLSLGTVVVEAALRSGSLISARLAMEQGREVFAVPGSVLNPLSAGCHRLIRDGAKLTANVDDIVEELVGIAAPPPGDADPFAGCNEGQRQLLVAMGSEPMNVDALSQISGMPASELLSLLIGLEIDGFVSALPGGYCLSTRSLEALMRRQAGG